MSRLAAIIRGGLLNACGSGSGKAVDRYEQSLREYFGAADAVAYWKGRVALYAMLRGLGVGPGDDVVMPGYTCVVVPNAVRYAGARPIYVDIDPQTYNVTAEGVRQALTPATKAIIVQHSYGLPADMEAILDVARSRNLPVLEDCCHAFGSRWHGRLVGTFGAGAFFSGQWNKSYSTGLGGMAVMSDAALAARVRELTDATCASPGRLVRSVISAQLLAFHLLVFPRTFGLAMRVFRWLGRRGLMVGSSSVQEVEGQTPEGFFRRISAGQAVVGTNELRHIEQNVAHRRQLAALYERVLREAGWPTPLISPGADPVMVRYPVPVTNKAELLAVAEKHLIEMGDWFNCPLHGAEAPLGNFAFDPASCPVAVRACDTVVNLPMHRRVSQRAARRTVDFLLRYGRPCQDIRHE